MQQVIQLMPTKVACRGIFKALSLSDARLRPYGMTHAKGQVYLDHEHIGKHPIIISIRNPYDRVYSLYYWLLHWIWGACGNPNPRVLFKDFPEYLNNCKKNDAVICAPCVDWEIVDGNRVATDVLRFETLEQDYDTMCKRYDIVNKMAETAQINFTWNNKEKYKDDSIDKRTLFTDQMRKEVEKFYKRDFDTYGYSYQDWVNAPWLRQTRIPLFKGEKDK